MSQEGVLIVGGSMSGLLAAIMLHRRGRKVDVFERVPGALEGRGAGIVAQPGLIARLDMMGIPMRELGVASTQRRILDRDGRVTITGNARRCSRPGSGCIGCCAMPSRPIAIIAEPPLRRLNNAVAALSLISLTAVMWRAAY